MFFTASGSIFEIGSARPDWQARQVSASDFDGEVWTPVAGLNSLGRIAGEWQTEETIRPDGYAPDEPQIPTIEKIARPASSMLVVAGVVDGDPGQAGMVAAETALHPFAFRISTPDGGQRRFIAFVLSADHVFDEASAVICWSFSIRLQSNVQRGA